MEYNKSAITFDKQIEQLKRRGLIITDDTIALHYLRTIGYYRLSGYWWPILKDKENKIFKNGSLFDDIIAIYEFDKELRHIVFGVIEDIEIAFRTKLIYHLSLELNPWWFENADNFKDVTEYSNTLASIERELSKTRENFIIQHNCKYNTDTRKPPAWKTLEISSLGTLSKLYGNLKNNIKAKNRIAIEFGTVNHTFLPSWLQSITQIRNITAHHCRLWNKNLPGRPRLLPNPPNPWLKNVPPVSEHFRLYIHICCMKYLLDQIKPFNELGIELDLLLKKYKNIDPAALGIKSDWLNEPLWLT